MKAYNFVLNVYYEGEDGLGATGLAKVQKRSLVLAHVVSIESKTNCQGVLQLLHF